MKTVPTYTFLAACIATSMATGQSNPPSSDDSRTLDPIQVVGQRIGSGSSTPEVERYIDTPLGLDSKLPYSIFETPRSVETLTKEQFNEWGAQNLEEASRYIPGVQSGYYGLDTRQDFIRIRGLQSLNYRDGLQYNFNFYNNTPIEAYALEQVDFVKGPASILFGRGTVGGTVNSTSKIARSGATSEAMVGYGSHDRFQMGLDYNTALNKEETLFFRMVGYYRDSDTYVDYVNDDSWFIMPSLTWQPSADTSLTLLLNFQENRSKPSLVFFPNEALRVPGETLTNNRYAGEPDLDHYNTEQASASLIFKHAFSDEYSISSTLRYVDSSADYVEHTLVPPAIGDTFIFPLPAGNYHRILYGADSDNQVFSGNMVFRVQKETGPLSHDLRIGVDYAQADRDRYTLPNNPGLFGLPYAYGNFIDVHNPVYGVGVTPLPARTNLLAVKEEMLGVFVHDRIQWGNLIATAGARFDDYSLESNQQATDEQKSWVFDAALMYQFENGISPYYSYSESFEPQGIDTVTNKTLKPKEGTQHEIGVKWMPGKDTLIVASYFQIDEENRTVSNGLGGTVQSGSVEVDGAEFSVRHRFHDFYLLAGYTYLNTANHDMAGSPELSGVPKHQASAWVTYRPQDGPLEGFRAGFGARFTGRSSDGFDTVETASNTLFDAMVGYQWRNMDVQLSVTNLFDKQYVQTRETSQQLGPLGPTTTNAFLGQDRAINLSATYRF